MSTFKWVAAGLASLLLISLTTLAQPAPGKQAPGGPNAARGQAGVGFNAMHTQDVLASLKDKIEVTEEQWVKLSPKLEKVLVARQNMNTGDGMNWQSSNNSKPTFKASSAKPDSPAGRAMQAVRDAVADEQTSKEDLGKKMNAVRQARVKARAEYEAAVQELVESITPRQEAILMTFGVVE